MPRERATTDTIDAMSARSPSLSSRSFFISRPLSLSCRFFAPQDKTKCKRRIDMSDVSCVVRSGLSDQFVLCVPSEYDYHYSSTKKSDICNVIAEYYHSTTGKALEITVVDDADLRTYVTTKAETKKMRDRNDLDDFVMVKEQSHRRNTVMHFSRKADDQVCLEDFDLLKVLGKGSFGKVMQVSFKRTGEVLAMKVLHKDAVIQRNQMTHTKAERHILQAVQHPFLVGLRYAFQNEAKLYMVLDYLNGGELFFHLKQARRFDEPRARFYSAEIALALGHLHSIGIIYRDLKPENILLDSEGHLRITDFGLAKEEVKDNNSARTFCGTPEYLAPEILLDKGHGRAVDWWSLGTLMYDMLSGLPPFYDQNLNAMYKKILHNELRFPSFFSAASRDILQRLLDRDPEKRLGSSEDDVEDIKVHEFFSAIDWDLLLQKKVQPPFKPAVAGTKDVSNFDTCFTEEKAQDSFVDKSTLARIQQQGTGDFEGFTYVPKSQLKK